MGYESAIRLASFRGRFLLAALAEHAWPRRRLTVSKEQLWFCNLFVVIINTLVVQLMILITPVALAKLARATGCGILNLVLPMRSLETVLIILAFDLVIYMRHSAILAISPDASYTKLQSIGD